VREVYALRTRGSRGFTLVELLIVLVVIGILSGSLMLVMGSGADRSKATRVISDMAVLKRAAMVHFSDSGSMPSDPEELRPYVAKYHLAGPDGIPYGISTGESGSGVAVNLDNAPGGVKDQLARLASRVALYADPSFTEYYSGGTVAYTPFSRIGTPNGDGNPSFSPGEADFSRIYNAALNETRWITTDGGFTAEGSGRMLFADQEWGDFEMKIDTQFLALAPNPGFAVYYRATDNGGNLPQAGYSFQFEPRYQLPDGSWTGTGYFRVRKYENGNESTQPATHVKITDVLGPDYDMNANYQVTIRTEGERHQIFISDGSTEYEVFDYTDTGPSSGQSGLRLWSNTGVSLQNIEITPID
jgi:general secretion pathway protein G